jgi:hypothetical protein
MVGFREPEVAAGVPGLVRSAQFPGRKIVPVLPGFSYRLLGTNVGSRREIGVGVDLNRRAATRDAPRTGECDLAVLRFSAPEKGDPGAVRTRVGTDSLSPKAGQFPRSRWKGTRGQHWPTGNRLGEQAEQYSASTAGNTDRPGGVRQDTTAGSSAQHDDNKNESCEL